MLWVFSLTRSYSSSHSARNLARHTACTCRRKPETANQAGRMTTDLRPTQILVHVISWRKSTLPPTLNV